MTTSTQTQLRRGTATQVAAMTPATGEVVVDNTNKRLHVGDGSSAGGIATPNYADLQTQAFTFATMSGTGNAIVLTNTVPIVAYAAPQCFQFKATATNVSGAMTAAIDGLTTKSIKQMQSGSLSDPPAGAVTSGGIYEVTYDGTLFQLGGGSSSSSGTDRQTFNSSGTWTKPTGFPSTSMAHIECWGGGGGAQNSAGGGGGGSYKSRWLPLSSLGSTETVTIGAGGTHGSPGTNGGNTTFGSWVTAQGGNGGNSAFGGGAGGGFASTSSSRTNDTGGQGYGSDTSGTPAAGGYETGGGGGSSTSIAGAPSVYGGGGGGGHNGAAGTSQFGGTGGTGIGSTGGNGVQPGGGGGAGTSTGGNGAAGQIQVTVIA